MADARNNRYLSSLRGLLYAPAIRQVIFLAGVAGGVAVGMSLYSSIREPVYKPLDYQINQSNLASVVDTLDKSGITYKIDESNGMVLVDESSVQMAKMKLAAAGIAKDDSFNFSYLNNQGGIGNSQFQENARYARALEGDLSRTISGLEGISNAKVHIAMPQNNLFSDENHKPTASIVVNMAPGLSSDKDKIRAIIQIVASSVPGLDPQDVAITDQYGHYLSNSFDESSLANAEHLSYQNNLQNYFEKRIESMISPLIGENRVNVRVSANIDFTQQEEAQESYDPNQKVIRSEQQLTEETGSSGSTGAPGSLANTPPEGDSAPSSAKSSSSSEGRSQSIKNYEISKSVTYKKVTQPKINSLSVAVVVDNDVTVDPKTNKTTSKPLDKDKLAKITEIVKATIGFDEKRGDNVTVVNSVFKPMTIDTPPPVIHFWEQAWFWDTIKKTIGIILGFALLFLLYKKLSTYMKTAPAPIQAPMINTGDEDIHRLTSELHGLKQAKMDRLKELASKDPTRVALIIKNMVGK